MFYICNMIHREIEFKAINAGYYNHSTNEGVIQWEYGYYAFMRMPGGIDNGVKGNHRIFNDNGSKIVIKETVCQFTGLKDKKDVKIFESDIITDGTTNYEVRWIWSGFKILNGKTYIDFVHLLKDMVVIGNVFDNPELQNTLE